MLRRAAAFFRGRRCDALGRAAYGNHSSPKAWSSVAAIRVSLIRRPCARRSLKTGAAATMRCSARARSMTPSVPSKGTPSALAARRASRSSMMAVAPLRAARASTADSPRPRPHSPIADGTSIGVNSPPNPASMARRPGSACGPFKISCATAEGMMSVRSGARSRSRRPILARVMIGDELTTQVSFMSQPADSGWQPTARPDRPGMEKPRNGQGRR